MQSTGVGLPERLNRPVIQMEKSNLTARYVNMPEVTNGRQRLTSQEKSRGVKEILE